MRLFLLSMLTVALGIAAELPSVLIIGDSISIGYTDGVTARLDGKAIVKHHEGNAAHTNNGVEKLESWLGTTKWKVITFNFGLHDLKIMDNGQHQVSLADYESNMETITARLEKTGARLIFVTTTPVPEGQLSPLRKPGDEVQFNKVALRVMAKHKVRVLDLYAYAKPRLAQIQGKENVHFTKEGRDELAGVVAKAIAEELQK